MFTYKDPTIAELDAQICEVHVKVGRKLTSCAKLINKLDNRQHEADEHLQKAGILLAEHKVSLNVPHIALAAAKFPATELKLKVAEYELKRKIDECKRLEAKHLDGHKAEIRVKKEKKQLTQTVDSLTARLEGKVAPDEKRWKADNERLKQALAVLRAQLNIKSEECEAKDAFIASRERDIADLSDDFAIYQKITSEALSKGHEGCDELHAALDEQCEMLVAERNTLQSNLNRLVFERDDLQSRFDDAIKSHQRGLEDYNDLQCGVSPSYTFCPTHIERALRI